MTVDGSAPARLEAEVSIYDEVRAFGDSFVAALAANDVEAILDHFEPEARLIVPGRSPVAGHAELRAYFQAGPAGIHIKSYTTKEIFEDGSLVVEFGSEVFADRHADGSISDFPMSYVAVFRRGAEGRLRLLVDCVSPDIPD